MVLGQEILSVSPARELMARTAAAYAVAKLRALLATQRQVRLIAATGASQLEFLQNLTTAADIDWKRVELFHLDEYVGIGQDHPASFARYIKERFINPTGIEHFHLLDGLSDPEVVIRETGELIRQAPVDLAFVGIGENGHLAFNDPPADFETEAPYLVVNLDEACRRQQVGEGWFRSLAEVPERAISMSVQQILKTRSIVCIVPDKRKADAVYKSLTGPVTPAVPASILTTHQDVRFFLDENSAKFLAEAARQPSAKE
jgi:glucosamine-6-phosphate deaminase